MGRRFDHKHYKALLAASAARDEMLSKREDSQDTTERAEFQAKADQFDKVASEEYKMIWADGPLRIKEPGEIKWNEHRYGAGYTYSHPDYGPLTREHAILLLDEGEVDYISVNGNNVRSSEELTQTEDDINNYG